MRFVMIIILHLFLITILIYLLSFIKLYSENSIQTSFF